ncbi:UbiA family prenyltransferase [Nocardioides sp.]|uniref:UbiA family prenyltransferase n=1 Tax=Nocardioides sp. TaxID=35761 RepID=UPI0035680E87
MATTKRSGNEHSESDATSGIVGADETAVPAPGSTPSGERRRSLRELGPVLLWRAAHPRQALVTAAAVAIAAAMTDRAPREIVLVFATVVVGQAILGWHNDLTDRRRDLKHEARNKPLVQGLLDPGTVWFAVTVAVLLVIPLSISSGVTAGSAYLLSLAAGLLANVVLRTGPLSWLPWAVSFGLLPAYLSYGGWGGGQVAGDPPTLLMTLLAAMLGVGVHFLRALPGLVADHADGYRHLPLQLALKLGATRVLVISSLYTAAVVVAMLVTGSTVGLSR